MRDFVVFLSAAAISFCLTPVVAWFARRQKILDYPDTRKTHSRPTPLLGGVAVYLGFFLTIALGMPHTRPFVGVLIGSTLIFGISLLNDLRGLSAFTRLLFQFLGALVMIFFDVKVSFLPSSVWGNVGEILITFLWIIGITNAMNFLDGLDGLVAGLSLITGIFFYLVARQVNEMYFGLLVLAMAGASFGFLPHNFPVPFLYFKRKLLGIEKKPLPGEERARIFLGDCGATFLGAFYAGISVMGDLAEYNVLALTVPILLLGIPIFDMILITVMRIHEGKVSNLSSWLTYAGRDHFHHRLVDLGFSRGGSVFFIYCIALTLGTSAIVLRNAGPLDALLLLLNATLIFVLIALLMVTGRRATFKEMGKES